MGEVWTTPHLEELRLTPDGGFLARLAGDTGFNYLLGAEAELIRNIHGVAQVAELDGDEVGYLVGTVAAPPSYGAGSASNGPDLAGVRLGG